MLNNLFSKFSNQNSEDLKPSSEVINGCISYDFQCGLKAHQEQINLDQDFRLADILLELNLKDLNFEKTSIIEVISTLFENKIIYKILLVILLPDGDGEIKSEELGKLKNSELQIIFNDFFSLNPTAKDWLKTIGEGLISIQTTRST